MDSRFHLYRQLMRKGFRAAQRYWDTRGGCTALVETFKEVERVLRKGGACQDVEIGEKLHLKIWIDGWRPEVEFHRYFPRYSQG